MPGRIIRRPQAVSDAEDCAVYLGSKETDELALRFLMALEWTLEFLAENPGSGRDCQFRSPKYRDICSWSIKDFPNHLVFFRPLEDGIEVIRILHGARDLEGLFASDEE